MSIRFVAAAAFSAAILMALPVRAQDASKKTVRIATEGAYAPWNFTKAGQLDGFEIELAKSICERVELNCEFVSQNWDGIIPGLTSGKYDAIMAAISITDKRLQVMDFTIPYARSRNGFFTSPDSELVKLPGTGEAFDLANNEAEAVKAMDTMRPMLKGKVIGVQGSSTNASFVEQYFKDDIEVREYKTTEQQELDLLAGRIDAIVQANTSLATTKNNPEFKGYDIFGPTFFGGPLGKGVAIGLRKDDAELKVLLDKGIQSAIDDKTVQTLAEKWFDVDLTPVQK